MLALSRLNKTLTERRKAQKREDIKVSFRSIRKKPRLSSWHLPSTITKFHQLREKQLRVMPGVEEFVLEGSGANLFFDGLGDLQRPPLERGGVVTFQQQARLGFGARIAKQDAAAVRG